MLDEKRVGVSVPVLIRTQGVQFGMLEYMSAVALNITKLFPHNKTHFRHRLNQNVNCDIVSFYEVAVSLQLFKTCYQAVVKKYIRGFITVYH